MDNRSSAKPRSVFFSVIALLCVCALVSRFLVQLTLVQGDSMLPSYHSGQLVLLDRFHTDYKTGQVILFRCDALGGCLLKRIAACGGDSVEIREGTLYINGRKAEGYGRIDYAGRAARKITVPEGCFFVLGDNLSHSKDSRCDEVGFVPSDSIRGAVIGG